MEGTTENIQVLETNPEAMEEKPVIEKETKTIEEGTTRVKETASTEPEPKAEPVKEEEKAVEEPVVKETTEETEPTIEEQKPEKEVAVEEKKPLEGEKPSDGGKDGGPVEAPPEEPPASMHFVKIARIPKEVFNFMVKDEGDEGTVRLNLTQLKLMVAELWKMGRYVNGSVWDECAFPKLDLAIPSCAQKFTIIPEFNAVNAVATEEKVAANIEKYRDQEKKQYAKMTEHQKRKTWKDLNREYIIADNVITSAGAATATTENPKVLYLKKASNVEEALPSQIKPADPPVAEATGKTGKAAIKSDGKNDRKRILSATTAPAEGQTPPKKPDINKAKGPAGPKATPQAQTQNKNVMKKNGNRPAFSTPKTANLKAQNKPNYPVRFPEPKKTSGMRQGNPWREEPRPRNDFAFNSHPYYQQGNRFQPPGPSGFGYPPRDVYPLRDAYYDPSPMMDQRLYDGPASVGGGNYGMEPRQEYRTTFDDYSSRSFSSGYGGPSAYGHPRKDPAYDSAVQHGYGPRF